MDNSTLVGKLEICFLIVAVGGNYFKSFSNFRVMDLLTGNRTRVILPFTLLKWPSSVWMWPF